MNSDDLRKKEVCWKAVGRLIDLKSGRSRPGREQRADMFGIQEAGSSWALLCSEASRTPTSLRLRVQPSLRWSMYLTVALLVRREL